MKVDFENPYRRQHQAYFNGARIGDEPAGDCWRTAVACLLEVPRDSVPHFADLYPEGLAWWYATVDYVEMVRPGLTLRVLPVDFPVYEKPLESPDRVIATGKVLDRSWGHCVLLNAISGAIVWDPFPAPADIIDPSTINEVYGLVSKDI